MKTNFSRDQLRSIVERIENLESERKALAEDIKEVKAEAKGHGFDVKIINKLLALRKMDAAERSTMEEMIDLYESAMSFDDTPLSKAAPQPVPPHPRDPVAKEVAAIVEDAAPGLKVVDEPPHDPETGEVIEYRGPIESLTPHIGDEGDLAEGACRGVPYTEPDLAAARRADFADDLEIPPYCDRRHEARRVPEAAE